MVQENLIFDRNEVAGVVGLNYAVVKNWSTGKPLSIKPSVRAPGKRGAISLYSVTDVYRMGIVAALVARGIDPHVASRVLDSIQDAWLEKQTRNLLVIDVSDPERVRVRHSDASGQFAVMEAMLAHGTQFAIVFPLRQVLDTLDAEIAKVLRRRK